MLLFRGYTEARPCIDYDCDAGIQIGGYRLRYLIQMISHFMTFDVCYNSKWILQWSILPWTD